MIENVAVTPSIESELAVAPLPAVRAAGRGTLRFGEVFLGLFALITWAVLFGAGIIVGTQPYRDQLGRPESLAFLKALQYGLIVITCYTVTNVLLLCCVASVMGGLCRATTMREERKSESGELGGICYPTRIVQGFFVYLLVISGVLLIVGEHPFQTPTQDQYIRMAGFLSLFSFLAGYNPDMFRQMVQKITRVVEDRVKPPER